MTPQERSRLEELDRILRMDTVREQILPIASGVRAELGRRPQALMTWAPISLELFGGELPAGIRSSWVFVLRAGADTGAERHPNSHQRMMSMEGSGNMRTEEQGEWRSNFLISQRDASLEERWISIPPNTWHRPVIGNETDWVVISFHTVLAEDLIEERPSTGTRGGTKQVKYLGA